MPNRPVRVILLAPTKVTGGITTWARFLMQNSSEQRALYEVIDTSKCDGALGMPRTLGVAARSIWDGLRRMVRVLHRLVFFRPDVVWFTCSPSIGPAIRDVPAVALLRAFGIPSIVHFHGGHLPGYFGGPLPLRLLRRLGFRLADRLFVITREIEREARRLFPDRQVVFVPNMIEDELFEREAVIPKKIRPACNDSPLKMIHVARQYPAKGPLELVRAMAHVGEKVVCELVGPAAPSHERRIQGLIEELGVGDRIRLAGPKYGQDLIDCYRQADLFCLPTHAEGFPMTVLEAMAYGIPIIATDVGNIADMIGAGTPSPAGVVLTGPAPADPKKLAEAIDRLAGDMVLREQMSRNGRERLAEHYLGSKVVPELESLVQELYVSPGEPENLHRWGYDC